MIVEWKGYTICPGAHLRGVDLTGAPLAGAQLAGIDLAYAKLDGVDLTGVCLIGANLYKASARRTNFQHAQLQGACLGEIQAEDADLSFADLEGANLCEGQFPGAKFVEARLDGANAYRGNFRGASFVRASMRFSKFIETDLDGANLFQVDRSGALLCGIRKFSRSSLVVPKTPQETMRREAWGVAIGYDCRPRKLRKKAGVGAMRTVDAQGMGAEIVRRVWRRQAWVVNWEWQWVSQALPNLWDDLSAQQLSTFARCSLGILWRSIHVPSICGCLARGSLRVAGWWQGMPTWRISSGIRWR